MLGLYDTEVARGSRVACLATLYILLSTVIAKIVVPLFQIEVYQSLGHTGGIQTTRVFGLN